MLRHSGATRASVAVAIEPAATTVTATAAATSTPDPVTPINPAAEYVITVADNGSGFADREPGRGLTGIRERAELFGGMLETGRSPSGGAEVVVRIPIREGTP